MKKFLGRYAMAILVGMAIFGCICAGAGLIDWHPLKERNRKFGPGIEVVYLGKGLDFPVSKAVRIFVRSTISESKKLFIDNSLSLYQVYSDGGRGSECQEKPLKTGGAVVWRMELPIRSNDGKTIIARLVPDEGDQIDGAANHRWCVVNEMTFNNSESLFSEF